jgi:tetratricopeptide (TPR) repeat protein
MSKPDQAASAAIAQAQAECQKGNAAGAVPLLRQVAGRNESSPEQVFEAAKMAVNVGLDQEPFAWFLKAGRRALDEGDIEIARESFEAAGMVDGKSYEPLFELGRVEIAAGNKAGGLERFANVLRKSNYTFAPALFEAGRVYEGDGLIDQAILTFKRIVERDKGHVGALMHLGALHAAKHMGPDAVAYYQQGADAAKKAMDFSAAYRCAQEVLSIDPGNSRARQLQIELERADPDISRQPVAPVVTVVAPPITPMPAAPPELISEAAGGTMLPPDFAVIEQQSKATAELAQVTAAVAQAYKKRVTIEEQLKTAQEALEMATSERKGAEDELAGLKQQLEIVTKARAAEEGALTALVGKLARTRSGLEVLSSLLESVEETQKQAATVADSVTQLRSDAEALRQRSDKAKNDAGGVEHGISEQATRLTAARADAEAAEKTLRETRAHFEQVLSEANLAAEALKGAQTRADAMREQLDNAELQVMEAMDRHKSVSADAVVVANSAVEMDAALASTLELQKNVDAMCSHLRQLAIAIVDRRHKTETALAEIDGLRDTRAAASADSDIAKLEAGLAAAIAEASKTQRQPKAASTSPNGAAAEAKPAPSAAKADDKSPQGRYNKALALLDAHKGDEATKLFESLEDEKEFAVLAQVGMGRCLQAAGKIDDAVSRYSKALETSGYPDSQYHEALYNMGSAYESRGDAESLELALWALEEIATAAPDFRDVGARVAAVRAKMEAGTAKTPAKGSAKK